MLVSEHKPHNIDDILLHVSVKPHRTLVKKILNVVLQNFPLFACSLMCPTSKNFCTGHWLHFVKWIVKRRLNVYVLDYFLVDCILNENHEVASPNIPAKVRKSWNIMINCISEWDYNNDFLTNTYTITDWLEWLWRPGWHLQFPKKTLETTGKY